MKKFISTFLLGALFYFGGTFQTKACVNPDSVVIIIVTYDTVTNAPFITNVEIRLTNMRLMNETPNKFCSCALSEWTQLFQNVDYIAFVDSGTNDPYLGFGAWNNTAASTTAWNNSAGGYNWAGYVSDLVGSGLKATEPVDLVIRASTLPPLKYTLVGDSTLAINSLQDEIKAGYLGTDEWSMANNDLVASHQGIRSFDPAFRPGNSVNYAIADSSYFTQLDNDILNNIPTSIQGFDQSMNSINIYPNPSNGALNVELKLEKSEKVQIILFDMLGNEVSDLTNEYYTSGNHIITSNTKDLDKGVYLLKMTVGSEELTSKILVN